MPGPSNVHVWALWLSYQRTRRERKKERNFGPPTLRAPWGTTVQPSPFNPLRFKPPRFLFVNMTKAGSDPPETAVRARPDATEGNRTTHNTRDPSLREPVIPQHTSCAEGLSHTCGTGRWSNKDKENAGRTAREDSAPPADPRRLDPSLQNLRNRQRACLGQGGEELGGLRAPPSTHFCGQHHQSGPSTIASQLRVGPLLAASCRFQRPSQKRRGAWSNHGGVNGEGTSEQGQPVWHDLKSSAVQD